MAVWQYIRRNIRQLFLKIKFSEMAPASEYLPLSLEKGMVLSQPFTPQQTGLSEILLSFESSGQLTAQSAVQILLEIREPIQSKVLYSKLYHGDNLNVFTRTIVNPPSGLLKPGTTYELNLSVVRLSPGLGLKLHTLQHADNELKINQEPTGMSLALVLAYTRLNTKPLLLALLVLAVAAALFILPQPVIGDLFTSFPLIPLLLAPLLTMLITELLNTVNERFWLKPSLFLLSYLVVLFFQSLLLAITGLPGLAVYITLVLFCLLAIVNHMKQFFRGDPLFAADIASFGMAVKTGGQLVYEVQIRLLLAFLSIFVFIGVFHHMQNEPLISGSRLFWLAFSVIGTGLLSWLVLFNDTLAGRKLGIGNRPWNLMNDYRAGGFIVPFCRSIREVFIKTPRKAEKIPDRFYVSPVQRQKPSQDNPNILVVMSESFCDFRNIGPFTTSEPVMPFFDSLKQRDNVISGNLLVPIFGGGTSNTEFEYLTGSSMYFLSDASVPYISAFKKPVHGLPDLLQQQGYQCLAVHPYDPTFYNRHHVYPLMGFEQYISMHDFPQNSYKNQFISDQADFEMILRQLEQKKQADRLFIFSVTMQNHFPYHGTEENKAKLRYHIKLPELTKADGAELFLSKLRESDDALKNLIQRLEQITEPTLLVFFGDHLPGNNSSFNSLYSSLFGKPLASLNFEETRKLYETPYLIWANYPLPKLQKPLISSNFLGLMTLDLAGLARSPFYDFLSDTHQSIEAIGSKFIQTENAIYNHHQIPEELSTLLSRYWHYQYDHINRPLKRG